MSRHRQRWFSALLTSLLALVILTPPGPRGVPAPLIEADTAGETMPEGLMDALLEVSSRPFVASADGYHAHAGGLDFALRARGLQATADGLAWGLALSGFGRGQQIAFLPQAEIIQTPTRLEYRRGLLTEWYRDTALGLEQGFTVHRAPGGRGPLVVRLDLSTELAGVLDADGRGLSFVAPAGQILHLDHLTAWDASGAQLDASLRYAPGEVMLRVNDQDAAYPLTIDPLIYVEQEVIASGEALDQSGYSVAVSGDTALVGAHWDDVGGNEDQGSAYVFTRSGTAWSRQGQLTASDGAASDQFGYSVALSGDTALVGAYWDDVGANANQGSAYVFLRSGTTWSQQGQLTASDGVAYDQFGDSVALSGDTALVGAYMDDVGATKQGSAYVFLRSGTTWSQQGQLTASDGAANDQFGCSVAVSGDTALVGAHMDDVVATNQGSAYVFLRSGTTWSQQAQLTASDGAGLDEFGYSVALSGDTALVGARYDNVGATDQGSAYVFFRSGTTWSQQGQLTASDGAAYDYFGCSVGLSGDTALVGAFGDDIGVDADQGSASVFFRTGTTWGQQQKLTAYAGDYFGYSVAVSGDTALVGAPHDDVGANTDQGSAYVFTRSGTTWSQQAHLTAGDGEAGDNFGVSVALDGDSALVGAYWDNLGANKDQGSAYVFTRSGTTWSQQAQLTAKDGEAGDNFGVSVALDGDTALLGAYHDDGGAADQGSAYVFTYIGGSWDEEQPLTASDGAAYDYFGYSVALSGDTALVGAYGDDMPSKADQGSAYVYTRSGTSWTEQQKLTASDGVANDQFGYSVALSGDTALVGARWDSVGGHASQGSVYVFARSGTAWTQEAQLTAGEGAAGDYFGGAVALSGGVAVVGAQGVDVDTNTNQGSAYVFTGSGSSWRERGQLIASDGAGYDAFGYSVALSGDTALVGAFGKDVDANWDQGSAYFDTFSFPTYVPLALKGY